MNTEYKQQFDTAGFFRAPGLLSAAEALELEENLNRFIRDVVPGMDRKDAMHDDYSNPATLKQVAGMERDPWFDAFSKRPKFVQLAEHLLSGPVTSHGVQLFRKPPRTGKPTPPHQDGYYFCIEPNEALTIWITLDDVSAESGAVHYQSGSHRKGLREHGGTGVLGFSQGLSADDPEAGEAVCCPVHRGDALIHHSLTIHWAGANTSERDRRAIGLVYWSASAVENMAARDNYLASVARQRAALGVK